MTTIQRLYSLGIGTHYCGWFKGYITIELRGNKYDVMWTSGKDSHDPMTGNAISVEFTEQGFGMVFESAISMHLVRNESKIKQHVRFVENKIERAYRRKK